MCESFPSLAITVEGVRSHYRRLKEVRMHQICQRKDDRRVGRNIEQALIKQISAKRSVAYLAEKFAKSENEILAILTRLQLNGYNGLKIWNEDGAIMCQNSIKEMIKSTNKEFSLADLYEGRTIRVGIVSDTHIGSVHHAEKELNLVYDYFEKEGITEVFHAGDISEGFYTNRPTSISELTHVGFQAQLRKIIEDYPRRRGVTTYFITGNHDVTHMRNGFANIGETISMVREDLVYLGHNFAKVELTENLSMSLIHPTDGSSTTIGHKLQQIIEKNTFRRADIMLVGHYHKYCHLKHRGVHGWLLPSFEKQTGFMADNNLDSLVGALVLTIKVDAEGKLLAISDEYIDLERE